MRFVERPRNILYFSPSISRVRKSPGRIVICPHVLYELCFFLCIDNGILCLYLGEGVQQLCVQESHGTAICPLESVSFSLSFYFRCGLQRKMWLAENRKFHVLSNQNHSKLTRRCLLGTPPKDSDSISPSPGKPSSHFFHLCQQLRRLGEERIILFNVCLGSFSKRHSRFIVLMLAP